MAPGRVLFLALWLAAVASASGGAGRQDQAPATIRGRVIDPWGKPAAGAQVEFRLHVGGPAWNWSAIGMQAGTDGRFEYLNLPPGPTTVIARAPGFASSRPLALAVEPGQVLAEVELALREGGRLSGEIFAPDGSPGGGRTIQIRSTSAAERFGREIVSDAQGFFLLEALDPGTYAVAAIPEEMQRPGSGPVRGDALRRLSMATVEIVAGETCHVVLGKAPSEPVRLHGRIGGAGKGLEELMVMVLREGVGGIASATASSVGADGSYALVLDAPGDYLVLLGDPRSGEPCAEYLRRIPAGGAVQLDLDLPAGAIRGRVFGADGRGIAGVPLALYREGLPSFFEAFGGRRARSGADGSFAFELLPPGDYRARAGLAFEGAWNPTGHAVAVGPRVRLEGGRALEGLELELFRPGTLAGTVVDSNGKPVVGAVVFLRDEEARLINPHSAVVSVAAGRFAFPYVAPGRVTACARAGGECSPESEPVAIRAGESSDVRLCVAPGTTLRVRVLDGKGRAVHASLSVLDELDRDVGEMRDMESVKAMLATGFEARMRNFGPLAPGTYRVIAILPEGGTVERRVRLDGQQQQTIEFRSEG